MGTGIRIYTQGTAAALSLTGSATLANSTTYYIIRDSVPEQLTPKTFAFQILWDSAMAFAASPEDTLFDDVGDHAADVKWCPQNPSAVLSATAAGNPTVANALLTVVAGNAGSAVWHWNFSGAMRTRWKVVVTTGGVVTAKWNFKA